MDVKAAIEKAIALESLFQRAYEKLKHQTKNPSVSQILERLELDEIEHRHMLRTGLNYIEHAPDLFGDPIVSEEELDEYFELTNKALSQIEKNEITTLEALEKLSSLEMQLKDIHMKYLVPIMDDRLREVFIALSSYDQEHVKVIRKLINRNDIY